MQSEVKVLNLYFIAFSNKKDFGARERIMQSELPEQLQELQVKLVESEYQSQLSIKKQVVLEEKIKK